METLYARHRMDFSATATLESRQRCDHVAGRGIEMEFERHAPRRAVSGVYEEGNSEPASQNPAKGFTIGRALSRASLEHSVKDLLDW